MEGGSDIRTTVDVGPMVAKEGFAA